MPTTPKPLAQTPIRQIHDEVKALAAEFANHFVLRGPHFYPEIDRAEALRLYGQLCALAGRVSALEELERIVVSHFSDKK